MHTCLALHASHVMILSTWHRNSMRSCIHVAKTFVSHISHHLSHSLSSLLHVFRILLDFMTNNTFCSETGKRTTRGRITNRRCRCFAVSFVCSQGFRMRKSETQEYIWRSMGSLTWQVLVNRHFWHYILSCRITQFISLSHTHCNDAKPQ